LEITRNGTHPSNKAPASHFTGAVRVDPLFQAPAPARVVGASVTFEPGARTAWHAHPLGQTLVVTAGLGWAQRDGNSFSCRACASTVPSAAQTTPSSSQ